MEFFGADEHYINVAQAMIDLDKQKEEFAKARDVSNKVNTLGFGDTIRKKVAEYADVRDDVRASSVPKRKRRDAHDFRNDLVNSFVPDFGVHHQNAMIEHGTHQPRFLEYSDNTYLQYAHNNRDNLRGWLGLDLLSPNIDPKFHKATLINQTKKKKRKHRNDPGFRGY